MRMIGRILLLYNLLALFTTHVVGEKTCPPSCKPPETVTGCVAYRRASKCPEQGRDLSISEGECGCLWKSYMKFVEPEIKVIFTEEGEQCYVWASTICSIVLGKISGFTENALKNVLKRLELLESRIRQGNLGNKVAELVKHRRRNGVGMETDVSEFDDNADQQVSPEVSKEERYDINGDKKYFVGKAPQDEPWIEVMAENSNKDKASAPVDTQSKHWFDLHIQDDQFKLGVFVIILLLNILCVVIAIFCRCDRNKSQKVEVRPAGDLDTDIYKSSKKNGDPSKRSHIGEFIDKLRRHKQSKANKRPMYSYLEFDPSDRYEEHGSTHKSSSRRQSRGLYENISDQDLDTTYEEPVFKAREVHPNRYVGRKFSTSEDESPTKYIYDTVRQRDEQSRSVSFSMPSGMPMTADSPPGRKRGRRGWKSALVPLRMGLQTGN